MKSIKEESPMLSILLKDTLEQPNDNSIKYLSSSLEPKKKSNSKEFIPFINERDSTGKLIKSNNSNSTLSFSKFSPQIQKKSNQLSVPVAFYKTTWKSHPRVSKRSNDSIPVGLYNPKYSDKQSNMKQSKSSRFISESHARKSSLDFIDLNAIYSKNKASIPNSINMEKQLPRKILPSKKFSERNFLIPALNLPDYLKKLKGLYHTGELGKSKIYDIRKDANERTLELKEKLSQHIINLRNINTFYKNYGTTCSWKLSSELF